MGKKKTGPGTRKPSDPKRKAEAKRLFDSRIRELESPEARIFLRFAEVYPPVDMTLHVAEGLWAFLQWLKERGYRIVHSEEVFCVPFSHLVRKRNLK